MFESFDIVRIINLKDRRDRRAEMVEELRRAGVDGDPKVQFFEAIRPADKAGFTSIGLHGVFKSHLAILEEAAAKNASVLILEDDCDFSADVATARIDPSFDIFYGGYTASNPADLHASDIIGAHMMGFSARTAPKVCEYLKRLYAEGHHLSIDGAYVWYRRAHPSDKAIFAEPPLGWQRPSRSDIEPGPFYNRWIGLRSVVQGLRQLRRAVGTKRPVEMRRAKW